MIRWFACLALLAIAVFSGLLAYGALSNLWADYQDNSTANYLSLGLPAVAICIGSLVSAALLWRGRERSFK